MRIIIHIGDRREVVRSIMDPTLSENNFKLIHNLEESIYIYIYNIYRKAKQRWGK